MQPDTSREASARRGADIRTFLFADVRGYTRYTHEHGDEAASALAARFADIVRDAVPTFEGELLELRGDEATPCAGGGERATVLEVRPPLAA